MHFMSFMTNLKALRLPYSKMGGTGISSIARNFTQLEYLDLSGSRIPRGGIGYPPPLDVPILSPLFALTRLECLKIEPVLVRQFWDAQLIDYQTKKKLTGNIDNTPV